MEKCRRKWRDVSRRELEQTVHAVLSRLNDENKCITTSMIRNCFAEQYYKLFDELPDGESQEWQFRPYDKGELEEDADLSGWLFDLTWYSVVRRKDLGLCLIRDVALILESELSQNLTLTQHDFLKLLGFRSWVKVAIVKCSEEKCRNLVSNAIRECRNITEGRYMVWRVAGTKVVLEAEFDLFWESERILCKTIGGKMFEGENEHCWWKVLNGRISNGATFDYHAV